MENYVDPYLFGLTLSNELDKRAIIVLDTGSTLAWIMQSFRVKQGQRVFSAFGHSPMGYALPASIGASVARERKPVVCISGDGGIQMNIQELQTIVTQKLPIKIFIFNNQGYSMIRQFQKAYLKNHLTATGPKSGVVNPDFQKVADSYGIPSLRINSDQELGYKVWKAIEVKGPFLVEVMIDPEKEITPKLLFGSPIEDQSPKLPRGELEEIMTN